MTVDDVMWQELVAERDAALAKLATAEAANREWMAQWDAMVRRTEASENDRDSLLDQLCRKVPISEATIRLELAERERDTARAEAARLRQAIESVLYSEHSLGAHLDHLEAALEKR